MTRLPCIHFLDTPPRIAYISAGSNLGDRAGNLLGGLRALNETEGVLVEAVSAIHETAPHGGVPQPAYLNLAARLEVAPSLSPEALLVEMQKIELSFGRNRETETRWGPRTLDLDLLFFGDETRATGFLTLPHPRLWERPFVLVPLREIADPALLEKLGDKLAPSPATRPPTSTPICR